MRGKRASVATAETALKKDPEATEAEPEECVICFSDIEKKGRLKCMHTFCFECINDWGRRENTCPLCKARFTEIEVVNEVPLKNGKRKRASTIRVKNRDQGENHRLLGRQSAAALGFGEFMALLGGHRPPPMRAYFDVIRETPSMPANHAILPRNDRPLGVEAAMRRAVMGHAAMRHARHHSRTAPQRGRTPIRLVEDEVVVGATIPAGRTPTQAATQMLQQRSPPLVDLVDVVPPFMRSGEPAVVDMTQSPTAPQQAPGQQPPQQRPRLSHTTVADVGAAMLPMSPFAVATMTARGGATSSRDAEAQLQTPPNDFFDLLCEQATRPQQHAQPGPALIDLTDAIEMQQRDWLNEPFDDSIIHSPISFEW